MFLVKGTEEAVVRMVFSGVHVNVVDAASGEIRDLGCTLCGSLGLRNLQAAPWATCAPGRF